MIPREELAAIKALHDIAEAINHDCDTRGCAQCEDDNCRAVRYIPRLLAEVERLQRIETAATAFAFVWAEDAYFEKKPRCCPMAEAVDDAREALFAALRAAGSGE